MAGFMGSEWPLTWVGHGGEPWELKCPMVWYEGFMQVCDLLKAFITGGKEGSCVFQASPRVCVRPMKEHMA